MTRLMIATLGPIYLAILLAWYAAWLDSALEATREDWRRPPVANRERYEAELAAKLVDDDEVHWGFQLLALTDTRPADSAVYIGRPPLAVAA